MNPNPEHSKIDSKHTKFELIALFIQRKRLPFLKTGLKYLLTIIIIVSVSILLRVFVFEIMRVPSSSMENTLLSGDFVLMGKYHYGTRFFTKNGVYRSPSLSSIKRSDIIIFNDPIGDTILGNIANENYYKILQLYKRENIITNQKIYGNIIPRKIRERIQLVKRCVGLPGDHITIINNIVYINNKRIDDPKTSIPDSLEYVPDIAAVRYQLTKKPCERDYADMFPNDFTYPWSLSYFGPLYIPKAGMSCKINIHNISLYRRAIEIYENNTLKICDSAIFINNKEITNYTFKKNYYFVLGDNRDNSKDSRFWGFVPEDYIKGKVVMVLFSTSDSTFRWNRLFKKVK